ncbi:hypothetical protein DERP_011711 [Dermatophagoides pteronyssinus]|uniref:Uncharacterized protein n=1 Tax=Dermatophagoides pteronyssinus TaxID=6956 RepID=A0ABQ8J3A6_DERPT|nr:hypothetical protein DERP_011711 [Dermatophagoides pteronyssinus]
MLSQLTIFIMMMFVGSSFEQQQLILTNKTICNDKRIEHIDRLFIRLIGIGNGGRHYPTTKNDVGPFCRETDRIISIIEKFLNECLRDDASSISKIFLYSTKRYWKTFCNKKRRQQQQQNKKQQKLLQVSDCFNTIIEQIDCLNIFANRTRDLIQYRIGLNKVDYICCNQVELLRCADRLLTSTPCITENGHETLMDLFRTIKGDIVNYGCGDYNEFTDLCDKLKPLSRKQLDKTILINKQLKSFFFAVLMAIDSITL